MANGHSSEVYACTVDEPLSQRLPPTAIIAEVAADGSLETARIARTAETDGAAAFWCFPPQSIPMEGQLRPEMAIAHFATIAAATSLPLICFNYPLSGGLGYPHRRRCGWSRRCRRSRHNRMKEVLALLGKLPPASFARRW